MFDVNEFEKNQLQNAFNKIAVLFALIFFSIQRIFLNI